ncbi:uncharacterized protein N7473_013202 [Penicillium subrubescens]|uniref:uncharacterized protein n=1 Tax=Penicillium subrubescens TaxID=1316194 RepID=UPI002544F36C|nr:uncharacterized protein N7473_013202 [Penicillium subrubescens]KAJ5873643.1 hypothetical protein N7473_013202 [Penicillium subrubescens]
MRWGGTATDKAGFLAFIPEVRNRTFTPETIIHSFRDRGIWPFNPSIVVDPLIAKEPELPPLQVFSGDPDGEEAEARSSDTEELSTPTVPTTIRTVKRRTGRLLSQAEKLGIEASHQRFIASLEKACNDIIQKTELWMIAESNLARKAEVLGNLSTNRSKKRLSATGLVRGKDAKRSILRGGSKMRRRLGGRLWQPSEFLVMSNRSNTREI